jgi:transposase-like protein
VFPSVPRAFPTTLLDFQRLFPDEGACVAYLYEIRWPDGFACPKCRVAGEPYRFKSRPTVLRCRSCHADRWLTAGTIMQDSKMPLQVWFWAAYLVTAQTPGMSALQFQRQLGIGRYETAFHLLHKLRMAMVRPDRDRIGGEHIVEVDEAEVGGQTVGEGRGVHHMATVVAAVEVRRGDPEELQRKRARRRRQRHDKGLPMRGETYAGRLRLRHVPNRGSLALTTFVQDSVTPGTTVFTDGWQGYDALKRLGYDHERAVVGGDHEITQAVLPLIHLVFSNLKAWVLGTHHGVSKRHLQAYLNEYTFRFNRRFYPMGMFNSVLGIAARMRGPTRRAFLDGKWAHPKG